MGFARRLTALLLVCHIAVACINTTPKHGRRLYESHCGGCHGMAGEGLESLIPPLRSNPRVADFQNNLPCIIRYGVVDTFSLNGLKYEGRMEGLPYLTEIEITNIINYISDNMSPAIKKVRLEHVSHSLRHCM